MIPLLLALLPAARAAQVQCDPLAASGLLSDARIEEARVPLSHPELVAGLALASPETPPDLRAALSDLCQGVGPAGGPTLSVAPGPRWEEPTWSAHALSFTRTEQRGCSLYGRTVTVSVALAEGRSPRYTLMYRSPVTRTPVGDCADSPLWREERVLGDGTGAVQLYSVKDLDAGKVVHSSVRVRRATPQGWAEQVVLEPAPAHLLGGVDGPQVTVAGTSDEPWVVIHGSRVTVDGACQARGGQALWRGLPDGSWSYHEGRDALALLASRGAWRLAGDDAWMLVLAVQPEEDRAKAEVKAGKLARSLPPGEALQVLPSSSLPALNPGFLVVVPAPWPTEAEARKALQTWRDVPSGAYVKQAWEAVDPCGG